MQVSLANFQGFRAIPIPSDYWQELPSLASAYLGDKETCAQVCIERGTECMGFELHANASCTLGTVVPTWHNDYVPEYLHEGRRVFLKMQLMRRKAAVNVTQLVALIPGNVQVIPTAFEEPDYQSVSMPSNLAESVSEMLLSNYGRGMVTCSGYLVAGSYQQKCWYGKRIPNCTV